MKCREIDIIEYIEGRALGDVVSHVKECTSCKAKSSKMVGFTKLLTDQYTKGKKLEKELDKKLESIEIKRMKKLPAAITEKISELKGKSLISKIGKVIGEGNKNAKSFFDNIMSPRMHAMPASPKDITKSKKKSKKKTK